jgi:mercuric reductase
MTDTSGEDFDAVVIGAGEAGSILASRAVMEGYQVAMVFRPPYGSTCLNTGCVPSIRGRGPLRLAARGGGG